MICINVVQHKLAQNLRLAHAMPTLPIFVEREQDYNTRLNMMKGKMADKSCQDKSEENSPPLPSPPLPGSEEQISNKSCQDHVQKWCHCHHCRQEWFSL